MYREKAKEVSIRQYIKKNGRTARSFIVNEQDKVTELKYDEYIYFYNYQRIKLEIKLTPLEKRSQYVA